LGIPLAFVVAALLMAALILGLVALGQQLGFLVGRILGKPLGPTAAGLIGLLLLTALSSIPALGVLAQTLMVCMALGSVCFSRFQANVVNSH